MSAIINERESIDTSKQLFFFKKSLLVSFHFINADIITLHSLAFSSSFSNRRSFEDDQASVEEESKRCKLCSTGTDWLHASWFSFMTFISFITTFTFFFFFSFIYGRKREGCEGKNGHEGDACGPQGPINRLEMLPWAPSWRRHQQAFLFLFLRLAGWALRRSLMTRRKKRWKENSLVVSPHEEANSLSNSIILYK